MCVVDQLRSKREQHETLGVAHCTLAACAHAACSCFVPPLPSRPSFCPWSPQVRRLAGSTVVRNIEISGPETAEIFSLNLTLLTTLWNRFRALIKVCADVGTRLSFQSALHHSILEIGSSALDVSRGHILCAPHPKGSAQPVELAPTAHVVECCLFLSRLTRSSSPCCGRTR